MITKLKENDKVKADQYWPSKVGKKLVMDNKISVKFMSEVPEQDGIIRRSFNVKLEGNAQRFQVYVCHSHNIGT